VAARVLPFPTTGGRIFSHRGTHPTRTVQADILKGSQVFQLLALTNAAAFLDLAELAAQLVAGAPRSQRDS
jgi:hypothetical protein